MQGNRKTISFTVDEIEYEKIKAYARAKGHGGQHPTSTFAHYAVFQMMKKYPLSGAEIREIEGRDGKAHSGSKAVQPDALEGNRKRG